MKLLDGIKNGILGFIYGLDVYNFTKYLIEAKLEEIELNELKVNMMKHQDKIEEFIKIIDIEIKNKKK